MFGFKKKDPLAGLDSLQDSYNSSNTNEASRNPPSWEPVGQNETQSDDPFSNGDTQSQSAFDRYEDTGLAQTNNTGIPDYSNNASGSQTQGYAQQNSYSQKTPNFRVEQEGLNQELFPSAKENQSSFAPTNHHDMELISSKLDVIKAMVENVSHRVSLLEQKINNQKKW